MQVSEKCTKWNGKVAGVQTAAYDGVVKRDKRVNLGVALPDPSLNDKSHCK